MSGPSARTPSSARLAVILTVLLGAYGAAAAVKRGANAFGMDFYHYWAVPKAVEVSPEPLGSPYAAAPAYARTLSALASAEGDRRHRDAEKMRRELDLTGTPLSYVVLSWLPRGYSAAFAWFQAGVALSLLGAVAALGRALGRGWREVLLVAALALVVSEPFAVDQRVGNVNALQLGALVGLAALVAGRRARALAPALGAALAALVLLKPSVLAPCVALALSAGARLDRRGVALGLLGALGASAALGAGPVLFFDAPAVWSDWWRVLHEGGAARLSYPSEVGNVATARLISDGTGVPVGWASRLLLGGLALSGLGAGALGARRRGGGWRGAVEVARRGLGDPFLMAGLGVVVTLGASPLVWTHYFTLALLPALWLFWAAPRRPIGEGAAVISLLASSGALSGLVEGLVPAARAQPALYALAWGALWVGLLDRVAAAEGAGEPRAEAGQGVGRGLALVAALLAARAGAVTAERLAGVESALVPLGVLSAVVLAALGLARRSGQGAAAAVALAAALVLNFEPLVRALSAGGAGGAPWPIAPGPTGWAASALLLSCALPAIALAFGAGRSRVALAAVLGSLLMASSAVAYLVPRLLGSPELAAALLAWSWVPLGIGLLARWIGLDPASEYGSDA